ncbi:hypothetical protein D3C80_1173560 [compost metagenome]
MAPFVILNAGISGSKIQDKFPGEFKLTEFFTGLVKKELKAVIEVKLTLVVLVNNSVAVTA